MVKIKPWIQGLIDNLAGSNLIRSANIQHRNRLSLILLDSALEIAFKNFLEFEKKFNIPKDAIKERENLQKIIKKHTQFDDEVWDRIEFFYKLRCDLYHEEAEKTLTDSSIEEFHELVEFIINQLFGIDSSKLTPSTKDTYPTEQPAGAGIPLSRINGKINVVVVAVKESESRNALEIQEALERLGYRGKMAVGVINDNLKHWYPHLFYLDKTTGTWRLSAEGERKYDQLKESI